ncbi:hypothetical protein HYQ43_04670 [Paracoccus pantotrophus]|uniref:Uncharacterized protein n=1 Tax=Paracoccus pantotrophus TaxID=82367 RepID=A0A7H9BRG4_PARPN|nr:hypothetical protein [Paracoccus pantotrophus]QLH13576.1 hypothetical protein HYQ43_04670 [Paracoccus pantotrophus]
MIEVELPDGTIAEFPDGTSRDVMKAALQKRFGSQQLAQPERPQPGSLLDFPQIEPQPNVAQDMAAAGAAGLSRGATGILDLPGMIFGAGSRAGSWVAEKTGLASPEEAQAAHQMMTGAADVSRFGSGDKYRQAAAEATGGATEFRGDTTAGQYAGTAGEFVPGALLGPGSAVKNALAYGVVPGLASEGAGQLTEGTALEPYARAVAPIVAALAASKVVQPAAPKAPTVDDLKSQADGLYRAGAARPGADPASVQSLASQIDNELQALNIKTPTGRVLAEGNVKKFLDVLDDYKGQRMKPEQMQTMRRILTDAAGSADPADRRIGMALLEKFDDWRGQHVPEYQQADALYGRMKRAQDVDFRIEKAERRAASSGSGGNRVNAARQNIKALLDNPKASRGYSDVEKALMEDIVRGSPAVNTLRNVGKLSPTSGALPLLGSLTGVGVAPQVAVPAMGIAAAAKGGAEIMTNRQIDRLVQAILNGSPITVPRSEAAQSVIAALLGVNAGSAPQ